MGFQKKKKLFDMKVIIANTVTSSQNTIESTDYPGLDSKMDSIKVGESFDYDIGEANGGKVKLTFSGGFDKSGLPIKKTIHGTKPVRCLLNAGEICFPCLNRRRGDRKRRRVRGNKNCDDLDSVYLCLNPLITRQLILITRVTSANFPRRFSNLLAVLPAQHNNLPQNHRIRIGARAPRNNKNNFSFINSNLIINNFLKI